MLGRRLLQVGLGGCCLALLAACSSGLSSRTQTPQAQQGAPNGDSYVVQKGDTLYSIAFRSDMNFKTLARINNIAPPYRIYAGQRLALAKPRQAAPEPPRPAAAAVPSTPTAVSTPAVTTPLAAAPAPVISVVPAPAPTPAPVSAPSPAAPPAAPADEANIPSIYDSRIPIAWRWPLQGAVARGFQDGGNKGVDIAAREGEPVAVAANGKVVYSGQGLIGYGNLIIVKHSDKYLSAYGNNSRLLAREGDEVSVGQTIAEVGAVAGRQPALHFEIRRSGKPVNPLDYLPKR